MDCTDQRNVEEPVEEMTLSSLQHEVRLLRQSIQDQDKLKQKINELEQENKKIQETSVYLFYREAEIRLNKKIDELEKRNQLLSREAKMSFEKKKIDNLGTLEQINKLEKSENELKKELTDVQLELLKTQSTKIDQFALQDGEKILESLKSRIHDVTEGMNQMKLVLEIQKKDDELDYLLKQYLKGETTIQNLQKENAEFRIKFKNKDNHDTILISRLQEELREERKQVETANEQVHIIMDNVMHLEAKRVEESKKKHEEEVNKLKEEIRELYQTIQSVWR